MSTITLSARAAAELHRIWRALRRWMTVESPSRRALAEERAVVQVIVKGIEGWTAGAGRPPTEDELRHLLAPWAERARRAR